MAQQFILEINATSEDGVAVEQHLRANVKCSKEMGVGVIIHTFKSNPELRDMFLIATEAYLEEMQQERIKMN